MLRSFEGGTWRRSWSLLFSLPIPGFRSLRRLLHFVFPDLVFVWVPRGFFRNSCHATGTFHTVGRRLFKVFISRTFTYPNCQHAKAMEKTLKGNARLVAFNCCLRRRGEFGSHILHRGLMCCTLRLTVERFCLQADPQLSHKRTVWTPYKSISVLSPFLASIFCLIWQLISDTVGTIKKFKYPLGNDKGIHFWCIHVSTWSALRFL